MKRFLVLLAVVGLMAAVPLSHLALAKGHKVPKVTICHFDEEDGIGYVISVSQAGWDNGHSKHAGDCLMASEEGGIGVELEEGICICEAQ